MTRSRMFMDSLDHIADPTAGPPATLNASKGQHSAAAAVAPAPQLINASVTMCAWDHASRACRYIVSSRTGPFHGVKAPAHPSSINSSRHPKT
jgi:hypothetical protein